MSQLRVLVVGGGGGGATGGGGAGQVIENSSFTVTAIPYTITVGNGGAAGDNSINGTNGNDSIFGTITSNGGGGGGTFATNGVSGGNGGGAGSSNTPGVIGGIGNQFNGGNTTNISFTFPSAGGGGAGGVGQDSVSSSQSGAGGIGLSSNISGSLVTYGGGGGGGQNATSSGGGAGGTGGGGAGGNTATNGTSGTTNTGGGGGGCGNGVGRVGGIGGSGIVIISYRTDGSDGVSTSSSGGTVTTVGAYTIHTFTASGTFNVVTTSNVIKSATTVSIGTLKKNNFLIGVSKSVDYGPTITTGFWNGITPPTNGYTVYAQKSSQGPSIRLAANDSELITIAKQYGGTGMNTINDALNYLNGTSTNMVTNINYPDIITDGLTAIWDGGFVPSYPRTGTTWSDLSGNNYDLALVGGPTYSGSTIQVLLVGGGGGGSLGGGGGGQVYENLVENISTGAYSVIIGSGGTGSVTNTGLRGTNGGNTSFNSFIAYGGGAGGAAYGNGEENGVNGGNGGGAGAGGPVGISIGIGGVGVQYNGGNAVLGSPFYPGAGGGGATQSGFNNPDSFVGGNGGLGYLSSINGTSLRYGGGGGGGVYAAAGTGGSAGDTSAGAGGNTVTNGGNGAANRGGGGGGGGNGTTGGNGGSGVVIIAYKTDGSNGVSTGSTGGVITTSGAYTIHTFTASSTFSAVTLNGSGGVYFDGTNDTARSSSITLSYPQGFSLNMWFKISSLSASAGLFSFNGTNYINFSYSPGGGWFGWETGGPGGPTVNRLYYFVAPVANQVYNFTCTYNPATNTSIMYNNTTQVATDTSSIFATTSDTTQLKLDYDTAFSLFNGIIYSCYFYTNKVLTPTEVTQNYNALKGRYGL